jgi:hypothetical protein
VNKETFYTKDWKQIDTYVVDTFRSIIYVGLRPGYNSSTTFSIQDAEDICQDFCNEVGLGLTLKENEFIYKNGYEAGVEIGLINYPRFPKSNQDILLLSLELASILKERFNQHRVSVVCTDKTYMIGELD